MSDRFDELARRVAHIERKVDQLYAAIDQRLDQLDAAQFEQRLYLDVAYERLNARMDAGFARVCQRLAEPMEALRTATLLDPAEPEDPA